MKAKAREWLEAIRNGHRCPQILGVETEDDHCELCKEIFPVCVAPDGGFKNDVFRCPTTMYEFEAIKNAITKYTETGVPHPEGGGIDIVRLVMKVTAKKSNIGNERRVFSSARLHGSQGRSFDGCC